VKSLRLSNKHIEEKTRAYVFSQFYVYISKIPEDSNVLLFIQKIMVDLVFDLRKLEKLNLHPTHLELGPYIDSCVVIPPSVTHLEVFCFDKYVVIPPTVTSFYGHNGWKQKLGKHVSAVFYE
jgi:hypothetical protein